MKIKQIWHNYNDWEEYRFGMWRKISKSDRIQMLKKAIKFTGDAKLYGSYMMRVANEWKISCEHNLTDSSINRKAWIGHAACCLAIKAPEDVTREAWWYLTQKQQDDANDQADKAILFWEKKYLKNKCKQLSIFNRGWMRCQNTV